VARSMSARPALVRSPFLAAVLVLLPPASALNCAECVALQEGIHRAIVANISALEHRGQAGTTQTATLEIGQIIWHLCSSDSWRASRPRASLDEACREATRSHVDLMTEYWKEKTSDDYKDPVLALRMKRAVCPNPQLGACALEDLPTDYEPLRPQECALCRALTSDLAATVRLSRERPKTSKNDNYFRLIAQMGQACAELPMRRPIRPNERDDVSDLCEELWDDHEAALSKLALHRSASYAESLCTDVLEVCEQAAPLDGLYALDSDAPKDEL